MTETKDTANIPIGERRRVSRSYAVEWTGNHCVLVANDGTRYLPDDILPNGQTAKGYVATRPVNKYATRRGRKLMRLFIAQAGGK